MNPIYSAQIENGYREDKDFTRKSLLYCLIIALYKMMSDLCYYFFSTVYNYYSLTYNLNTLKLVETYFWFIVIIILMPKKINKFSHFANLMILIFTIIPMWTRYGFNDESWIYMFITNLAFILQIIIINYKKRFFIPSIKHSYQIICAISFLISVYVFGMFFIKLGLPSLTALNYFSVYEIRKELPSFPFSTYLITTLGSVLFPFYIAIFFSKRNYYKLLFFTGLQLLLYLYTGHKSFLFSVFLIIIVDIGIRTKYFSVILSGILAISLPGVFIISHFFESISIQFAMPISVIYRVLYLPAQIKFQFYDFISRHQFLYFSEGFIGKSLGTTTPYSKPFFYLIGEVYYNDVTSGANGGYLADAYTQIGFLGIILFAILFAILVKFVDNVSENMPLNVICACLASKIFILNDTSLLTSLLTGGMIFLVILVYSYDSQLKYNKILACSNVYHESKYKTKRKRVTIYG